WSAIDPNPSSQRHNECPADLRISASVASSLHQRYAEAAPLLTSRDRQAIAERRERLSAAAPARREKMERDALAQQDRTPISPSYTAYALGKVLGDGDHLFLNDSVTSGTDLANFVPTT